MSTAFGSSVFGRSVPSRRSSRLTRVLLVALLLLAGCETPREPDPEFSSRTPMETPTGPGNDVIVLVGTSSGADSWRGDGAFRGADVAISHLNRTRAEGESVIELITLDDGGDPEEARRLIEQEAAKQRTLGIVFAGPARVLPQVEPGLAERGIPAVLCFGDLHGAGLLTDHVFQVSSSYEWEAARIGRYVFRDRRYRRIGALVGDSLAGRVAQRSLRAVAARFGAPRPEFEVYSQIEDLDRGLARLKRRRVEAVVVEGGPAAGLGALERLARMDAAYRGTAAARTASLPKNSRTRSNSRDWRPQVIGFHGLMTRLPEGVSIPAGTVAADSYARGAHYLPIPSFEAFRREYSNWWGERPLSWERRSYEAVRLIGWAARNTPEGGDAAETLETLRGERFGGLDVSFGPRDHTAADPASVGLWVVPRAGVAPESDRLPDDFPWVPLNRGFSSNGRTTDIPPQDWRYLFRGAPRPGGEVPFVGTARFGVRTSRKDPVH